ncbi:MAG: hypothetical protein RLZZ74_3418 [Cyanobacteriota bacterium]|jgi:hypothetical protein
MRQLSWAITALLIVAWALKLNEMTLMLSQHNEALLQIIEALDAQDQRLQEMEGAKDVW